MCGILGFSSSTFLDIDLEELKDLMSHRGPDDFGTFLSQNKLVGLAHSRLAIQDLSGSGHQPMRSQDQSVCIVFNGEIYNFKQLRTELLSQGCVFNGSSDTEVLLNLYFKYRGSTDISPMLRRLNGIFAFAIWDSKYQHLWVARDQFGVKPLYYSCVGGLFAFASEMKALLPLSNLPPNLDCVALERYLTFLWAPGRRTPLVNACKLGPGELLNISSGEIVRHSVWHQASSYSPSLHLTYKKAVGDVRHYLEQAVHRQMVSDVPVGAFLSGGLDSSSVVAFAKQYDSSLNCFTIDVNYSNSNSTKDGFVDDLPYSLKVAKYLGVPLSVVKVQPSDVIASIEHMVWLLDEPLADPAALNVLFISRLARDNGIKVLLSGTGGDDLFTGYRRHLAFSNEKWWRWLPAITRSKLRTYTSYLPATQPLFRRIRSLFSGADLNGDMRIINYFRWIDRPDLLRLYTSSFHAAISESIPESPMLDFLEMLPSSVPDLQRMLALEQRFFLPDHNLTYTDRMSMAVGVEVRVPFLDPDLVGFAFSLPCRFKQRGRHGKWILKKAMEPFLPLDVIYRPKTGFGLPLRSWLQNDLRDWLSDVLSVERLRRRGLFDPVAVQRLILDNDEGRVDASYTLLSLACIEIWCKYFVDGFRPYSAAKEVNS